ncbi:MAG: phosphate/phosphite/phosphonate ABC transporter substrate-binding protein [Desulfurivibrionaceae bacterium]
MALPPSCPAHETPDIIKFGIVPYLSPKSIIEIFSPIAVRLEKKLGKKVQLTSAPDAKTFVERGKNGEYDLALPTTTTYYKIQPAGYRVIARGTPSFHTGIIVRRESEIKSIEQCRGKKIASHGEFSISYLFFRSQLEEKGINPDKDLDIHFLGKLDSVILGVINKQYDAAVLRVDALELSSVAALRGQLRVVGSSPEIPQFPFVVKNSMDERTVAAIREVLTSLSPDNPEDLEILKNLQIKKIVGATKADYDQFYEIIKNSEYFRQQ